MNKFAYWYGLWRERKHFVKPASVTEQAFGVHEVRWVKHNGRVWRMAFGGAFHNPGYVTILVFRGANDKHPLKLYQRQ